MKPDTNTVSNVAFSLACLMLLALGALEIEERVSGKSTTIPPGADPIESFDGRSISIADAQVQGSPKTEVVLIELSDFQCPFCSRHDKETHELIKTEFVDSGRIRQVFMHLPLPIHPHAQAAGEAAECAGRQGRFWEMRLEASATNCTCWGTASGLRYPLQNPVCGQFNYFIDGWFSNAADCQTACRGYANTHAPSACSFSCGEYPASQWWWEGYWEFTDFPMGGGYHTSSFPNYC
jgi:hypothetical protein